MILIQTLLHRAFPLMALTGLLLAGWGLLVTPDEIVSAHFVTPISLK
ncbi:hypothetical protein WDW37_06265 [Bdellovibrionota bacterium FG-1]